MNSKKLALMFASGALIVSAALFGTLAYFTDSESVANTFTVGNIDITLNEAYVNEDGTLTNAEDNTAIEMKDYLDADGMIPSDAVDVVRTDDVDKTGNQYKLVPGKTYVKDPVLTVKANSESAYVRMLVTFTKAAELDEIFDALAAVNNATVELTSIFNGYNADEWKYIGHSEDESENTITYEFRYKEVVAGTENDQELDALFDSFTVPGYINTAQVQSISDMSITVVGQAIQAETFDTEDAAWEAFNTQARLNPDPVTTTPSTGEDTSDEGAENSGTTGEMESAEPKLEGEESADEDTK